MSHGLDEIFAGYPARLSPEQVAAALGATPNTVRRWIREGDIPGYRVGAGTKSGWFVVKSELIEVLISRRNQPLPAGSDTKE